MKIFIFISLLLCFTTHKVAFSQNYPTEITFQEDDNYLDVNMGTLFIYDSLFVLHDSVEICDSKTYIDLSKIPKRGKCCIHLDFKGDTYKFHYYFEGFFLEGKEFYLSFAVDSYPSFDNYYYDYYSESELEYVKSINSCILESDEVEGFVVDRATYVDDR